MGDAENALPPSKKRAAGRELSRDNPGLDDEEDALEQETGTFKKASDDVLAGRRIVKVRRNQTPSTPSSNPFAGIQLVPPTKPSTTTTEPKAATQSVVEKPAPEDETKPDNVKEVAEKGKEEQEKQTESKGSEVEAETTVDKDDLVEKKSDAGDAKLKADDEQAVGSDENGKEDKENTESANVDSIAASTPMNSFQQLSSSQNAFTGLTGTGFSSSTFSFGTISKDGSALSGSTTSLFGLSNNGNSSLFGTSGASVVSKSDVNPNPPMQEVQVETGEENEKAVFAADSVLFEFSDRGWKERGKGEVKVNVSTSGVEKARIVMRSKGNYRLILNASLFPDMKLTNMEKRGITFACMNSTGEGKDGLSTFALKFRDASFVEGFRAAVTAHKDKTTTSPLKTPENSPKAPKN